MASCSSNNLPETKPFFRGTILDDDTKLFTFNLLIKRNGEEEERKGKNMNGQKRAKDQGDRPPKGSKGEEPNGKGSKNGERPAGAGDRDKSGATAGKGSNNKRNNERLLQFEEMLFSGLDNQMSLNGYCRNGYIVLSQDLGRNIFSVKGECHESANERDRKLFLNRGQTTL